MITEEQRIKRNKRQREYRARGKNKNTLKYEKTKKGFLVRLYRNMYSRVMGIQKLKAHLYEGKCILDRDDFYAWAMSDKTFHELWAVWEKSGHIRRLTPSVDRIDSSDGYRVGNMEWIPFHENCRRGAVSRWHS